VVRDEEVLHLFVYTDLRETITDVEKYGHFFKALAAGVAGTVGRCWV